MVRLPRLRAALVTLLVLVGLVAGVGAGVAAADPGSGNNHGGSYGFDSSCNDLHDTLSKIPLIGGVVGDAASLPCKELNVITHPGDAVNAVKDKVWDSTFGAMVSSLLDGLGQALVMSLTWWTKIPNARLLDSQDLFARIGSYTSVLQIYLLAASVMIGATRLALARRHARGEEAGEMAKVLARSVFGSWIAGAVVLGAARAGDSVSSWIINDATGGNAKGAAELIVKTAKYQAFSPGLVLILALVGLLGSIAMAIMTIVRQALMLVVLGMLPLASAASGTETGRAAHRKLWAWIIAFLLWKPVAALVLMIAFITADETNASTPTVAAPGWDGAQRQLVSLVLLCCTALVLPALMRLVAPAVAAAGTAGSGAGAAGAVIGASAAVATGGKALLGRGVAGAAGSGAVGSVASRTTGPAATGHGGTPRSTGQGGSPGGGATSGQPAGTTTRSSQGGVQPGTPVNPNPPPPGPGGAGRTGGWIGGPPSPRRGDPDNDIPI